MAEEPTEEEMEQLQAQIKALKERSNTLDTDVDATHKAAEAAKAEATAKSKELDKIKQRK